MIRGLRPCRHDLRVQSLLGVVQTAAFGNRTDPNRASGRVLGPKPGPHLADVRFRVVGRTYGTKAPRIMSRERRRTTDRAHVARGDGTVVARWCTRMASEGQSVRVVRSALFRIASPKSTSPCRRPSARNRALCYRRRDLREQRSRSGQAGRSTPGAPARRRRRACPQPTWPAASGRATLLDSGSS